MSNTKRKVFTFEESDVEWIDPLLVEWQKDNEGKRKSEFIAHLMQEYKESQNSGRTTFPDDIQNDFQQLNNDLDSEIVLSMRTRVLLSGFIFTNLLIFLVCLYCAFFS